MGTLKWKVAQPVKKKEKKRFLGEKPVSYWTRPTFFLFPFFLFRIVILKFSPGRKKMPIHFTETGNICFTNIDVLPFGGIELKMSSSSLSIRTVNGQLTRLLASSAALQY